MMIYIQLYPSFNDSGKEKKQQTNKQLYKYSQFKSFSSRQTRDRATDRVMIVHEFRHKLSFTTHN